MDALTDRRAESASAAPVRLRIPDAGVDAPVDAVGVQADGQMEVPEDAARVGWYRFGPAPGHPGSVVLAGHVDDAWGRAGSLAALHEVREGAEVEVELEDGTTTTYRIGSREQVAKADLAVDRLFARQGPEQLVLITCTGEWSRLSGHYEDNLVVVATPVEG
ncbi:class F sortase [Ornithinimicrobium sp. Y1847]|uniref:class F sortase n=1 Tax=Ornithinimicrobium sp. Y1847 TaxID=3405419 RepID=UPI003B67F3CC